MKFRWPWYVVLSLAPVGAGAAELDGAALSVAWGVPFVGILLSIALWPLLAPGFWHHHFGKVAAAWSLAFLLPFALVFGPGMAGVSLVHALLAEYLPFVILLTALFTVAVWGATFVSTKVLIAHSLTPAEIFLLRFALAYACIWPLSKGRLRADGWRDEALLAAAGACAPHLDAATQVLGIAACCGQGQAPNGIDEAVAAGSPQSHSPKA